jgi:uncharacterized membrane protein
MRKVCVTTDISSVTIKVYRKDCMSCIVTATELFVLLTYVQEKHTYFHPLLCTVITSGIFLVPSILSALLFSGFDPHMYVLIICDLIYAEYIQYLF